MAFKVAEAADKNLRRRYGAFNPGGFRKWFYTGEGGSRGHQFSEENAYLILGVAETSSFSEIKASFRKLAKETHPDLQSKIDAADSSHRFLQILAAYEILSDPKTRVHYDRYLLSQRVIFQKQSGKNSYIYAYNGPGTTRTTKQMEVVEWLKWYRLTINDILSQKKMVEGSGYFEKLESELYSAICAAYYGPFIDSMDLLPDSFEAEERSGNETSEVLHLVSGRDLFGSVNIVKKVTELSHGCEKRLTSVNKSSRGMHSYLSQKTFAKGESLGNEETHQMQNIEKSHADRTHDFYKDLELHIAGSVVAVANRMPPKSCYNGINSEDSQDHIRVFLNLQENQMHFQKLSSESLTGSSVESRILLGTITGLGTNPEEGSCSVYNNSGTKTHVIMKHRTMMVKHMHWFEVSDEVLSCECRCSRARLPPSKFWLFEPRCGMHDIGGWYVETFGKDKRGKTVPSRRQWYAFNAFEQSERRLHPAMYLMALAYRTLDLEDAKKRKVTVRNMVQPKLSSFLSWCKKLI